MTILQVDLKATLVRFAGFQIDLKGTRVDLKDPQVDLKDPQGDLKDPQVDLKGTQGDLKGRQSPLTLPRVGALPTDMGLPQVPGPISSIEAKFAGAEGKFSPIEG